MQEKYLPENIFFENLVYSGFMKIGTHLAELRQKADLSQYELAKLLGVPQSNIAYWEGSDKPPRSDVLPKLAKILGVRIERLLNINGKQERIGGPTGKVRSIFEQVSKLPKKQQEKIVEFVSAFVNQYQDQREARQ